MTIWNAIDDNTPTDKNLLLKKEFSELSTPLVVIGEVINFKGVTHHLWKGGYDSTVKIYKQETKDWDEKFTHWAELGNG